MQYFSALLVLFLVPCCLSIKVFNIVDYGAVGDGTTYDTKAFLSAVQAAYDNKGGQILFPSPGKFLLNQVQFGNIPDLQFYIEPNASILAPADPFNWTQKLNSTSFIYGYNLTNFQVTGGGSIDAQGLIWWQKYIAITRPRLFIVATSTNVSFLNVQLLNAPSFHLELSYVTDVEVGYVTIYAPPWTINTDGIDPEVCTNVYIHDTTITNGDDAVAVKQGTKNVLVENCTFNYGRGAVIGSITGDVTQNVTFRNIVLRNGLHGVRIKTHPGCLGNVTNSVYENIWMFNMTYPISIWMFYPPPCSSKPTGIDINYVLIKNVTATKNTYAGQILCSQDMPCRNIQMIDVNIEAANNTYDCQYAYGTYVNSSPTPCLLSGL